MESFSKKHNKIPDKRQKETLKALKTLKTLTEQKIFWVRLHLHFKHFEACNGFTSEIPAKIHKEHVYFYDGFRIFN